MRSAIELAKEAGFVYMDEDANEYILLEDLPEIAALVRAETIKAYRKGELDFQEAGRAACERMERAEREWVDLTDDEMWNVFVSKDWTGQPMYLMSAVIAAFKEKNK